MFGYTVSNNRSITTFWMEEKYGGNEKPKMLLIVVKVYRVEQRRIQHSINFAPEVA